QIPKQAVLRSAKQIAALRKKATQPPAGVLKACLLARDAEGHVARLGLHPEFREQANQIGIGAVVMYDKAGVHSKCLSRSGIFNRMGMRVAAETIGFLKKMNCELAAEQIRGRHPGNSRANDSDLLRFGRI